MNLTSCLHEESAKRHITQRAVGTIISVSNDAQDVGQGRCLYQPCHPIVNAIRHKTLRAAKQTKTKQTKKETNMSYTPEVQYNKL